MSAIERVMRAYESKHQLTANQAAFVLRELSKFIDELKARSRPTPVMLPETEYVESMRRGSSKMRSESTVDDSR